MNPEVKKLWIDALRSGKYKQGKSELRASPDHYCCLGVLCDLYVQLKPEGFPEGQWEEKANGGFVLFKKSDFIPPQVLEWAQTQTRSGVFCTNQGLDALSSANDRGVSFDGIAKLIEEHF